MKNRTFEGAAFLIVIAAAIPALGRNFSLPGKDVPAATVQFYQPNPAARLSIALKSKVRYSRTPVVVTVMVSNQGMEPLLINNRMLFSRYPLPGEIAFNIEGPGRKAYPLVRGVQAREIAETDLVLLGVGETIEREADLTDMYGVGKRGPYRIQVIYYSDADRQKNGLKSWRGAIASEASRFEIE
jgi:hypothetical protein